MRQWTPSCVFHWDIVAPAWVYLGIDGTTASRWLFARFCRDCEFLTATLSAHNEKKRRAHRSINTIASTCLKRVFFQKATSSLTTSTTLSRWMLCSVCFWNRAVWRKVTKKNFTFLVQVQLVIHPFVSRLSAEPNTKVARGLQAADSCIKLQ